MLYIQKHVCGHGWFNFIGLFMRKKTGKNKNNEYNPQFKEKKTFFSEKEIIFRSQNRAKVLTISAKAQLIFWTVVLLIGVWSFYSYHIYNKSGVIISVKNRELESTRDAYVDLMGDFMSLHKNIASMISSLGTKGGVKGDIEKYKRQASVVEDKIKQITSERDWASSQKIEEKISLSEAVLQRDIAASERDELKKQMNAMEDMLDELKEAEMEVLEKVSKISSREVSKIKSAFSEINSSMKKSGLYFNAQANRKNAKGGLFSPAPKAKIKDKVINEKISQIYKDINDLEYYKDVAQYVPLGKPVWSYWLTSQYGTRSDPFNKKRARHKGVDLASRTGNKIKVQAKGKVIKAEYSGGYGNLVVVDHGNGFVTKYGHMNKIYVKKGQYVDYDDTLGEVGTTGRSTGPHLHYEVIFQGKDVNPLPFVKAKIS